MLISQNILLHRVRINERSPQTNRFSYLNAFLRAIEVAVPTVLAFLIVSNKWPILLFVPAEHVHGADFIAELLARTLCVVYIEWHVA